MNDKIVIRKGMDRPLTDSEKINNRRIEIQKMEKELIRSAKIIKWKNHCILYGKFSAEKKLGKCYSEKFLNKYYK